MLKQDIQKELKESMLARNELKTSVIRMLLSAITYYEINKGAGYEASDDDVLSVINTQVKQRRDSIEQFEKAGRTDLAEKEKKEMELLVSYLPPQMSENEITELIKRVITETSPSGMKDMGKVISRVMMEAKGKADGSLISRIVKEQLNSLKS